MVWKIYKATRGVNFERNNTGEEFWKNTRSFPSGKAPSSNLNEGGTRKRGRELVRTKKKELKMSK